MSFVSYFPSELSEEVTAYAAIPEFIVVREDCTCYHGGIQTTTRWHVYDKAQILAENIGNFDVFFLAKHPDLIDDEHIVKIYMGVKPEDFLNKHQYILHAYCPYEEAVICEEKFVENLQNLTTEPYQEKDWNNVVISKPCSKHGNGVWKLTHFHKNCKYCIELRVDLNKYSEIDYQGDPE